MLPALPVLFIEPSAQKSHAFAPIPRNFPTQNPPVHFLRRIFVIFGIISLSYFDLNETLCDYEITEYCDCSAR